MLCPFTNTNYYLVFFLLFYYKNQNTYLWIFGKFCKVFFNRIFWKIHWTPSFSLTFFFTPIDPIFPFSNHFPPEIFRLIAFGLNVEIEIFIRSNSIITEQISNQLHKNINRSLLILNRTFFLSKTIDKINLYYKKIEKIYIDLRLKDWIISEAVYLFPMDHFFLQKIQKIRKCL